MISMKNEYDIYMEALRYYSGNASVTTNNELLNKDLLDKPSEEKRVENNS